MAGARGQTTIDFTVGASVFLLTVAFVFAFVPGLLSPFTGGQVSAPGVASRVADDLAQDQLAVPGDPYSLRSNVNGTLANATLDVPPTMSVNVTVGPQNGTTTASRGPAPPDGASVTTAWRVVTVDGTRTELRVTVW